MEILKIKVAKNYSFDNIVHGQERQLKFYFYTITHALITAIFLLKCFYPVKIFVLLLLLLLYILLHNTNKALL
jgi:hypothetical protein